jgi:hypothetical protein
VREEKNEDGEREKMKEKEETEKKGCGDEREE